MINPTFDLEIEFGSDKKIIAGVDEVGRGALAGPIVAAAVVFERYEKVLPRLLGVGDSKQISQKKRIELEEIIKENAIDLAVGEIDAETIDRIGIGAANILAFKNALDGLRRCDLALIDGRKFRGFPYNYRCFEKGESKSISIAAASIIAKNFRDALMARHAEIYSEYHFAENVGYGCQKHYAAIEKFGPCKIHRKSFLREFEAMHKTSLF